MFPYTEFASQHKDPAPLPDIINKEEEYKVEEIKGHHKKRKRHPILHSLERI